MWWSELVNLLVFISWKIKPKHRLQAVKFMETTYAQTEHKHLFRIMFLLQNLIKSLCWNWDYDTNMTDAVKLQMLRLWQSLQLISFTSGHRKQEQTSCLSRRNKHGSLECERNNKTPEICSSYKFKSHFAVSACSRLQFPRRPAGVSLPHLLNKTLYLGQKRNKSVTLSFDPVTLWLRAENKDKTPAKISEHSPVGA